MARTLITKLGIYAEHGDLATKFDKHPLGMLVRSDAHLAALIDMAESLILATGMNQAKAVDTTMNNLLINT